jgi:hypothetical protein
MSLENRSDQHFCQHSGARGRRCRMLVAPAPEDSAESHPQFCAYHLAQRKAKAAFPDPETLARELLRGVSQFSDASSVNRFLGNLLRQVARHRIPRRDAIALAYISQLLINTLGPLQKERDDLRDDLRDAEASRILLEHVAQARRARLAREHAEERHEETQAHP